MSQHLRSEADDLHEVLLAQLTGHRTEDARAARVALLVDDHGRVLVEGDRGAVVAAERLLGAHDDRAHDLAFLDGALRRGGLDRADDDVADQCVAAMVAADDPDAEDLAGAGVVGDPEAGLLLYHLATSTTSARRQRFVADSGRVSTMRTTSPTLAVFCSSCAWTLTPRRMTFLYRWCEVITSTLTTIVLAMALETTTPRRSWRRPRSWSGFGWRTIGLRSVLGGVRRRVFGDRRRRGRRFRFFFGSGWTDGASPSASAASLGAASASASAASAAGSSVAGSSAATSSATGSSAT